MYKKKPTICFNCQSNCFMTKSKKSGNIRQIHITKQFSKYNKTKPKHLSFKFQCQNIKTPTYGSKTE